MAGCESLRSRSKSEFRSSGIRNWTVNPCRCSGSSGAGSGPGGVFGATVDLFKTVNDLGNQGGGPSAADIEREAEEKRRRQEEMDAIFERQRQAEERKRRKEEERQRREREQKRQKVKKLMKRSSGLQPKKYGGLKPKTSEPRSVSRACAEAMAGAGFNV